MADIHGSPGSVATGLVPRRGRIHRAAIARVGSQEVRDVSVRQVGKVGFDPSYQVILRLDVGRRDERALVGVVLGRSSALESL